MEAMVLEGAMNIRRRSLVVSHPEQQLQQTEGDKHQVGGAVHHHQHSSIEMEKSGLEAVEKKGRMALLRSGPPARYVLGLMGFLACTYNFLLRVNMNITIVAMVNHTAVNVEYPSSEGPSADECALGNSSSSHALPENEKGTLVWSPDMQGMVLSSFFWGYVLTPLLGGRLAETIGPKNLLGWAILGTGALSLVVPVAANFHPMAVIAIRVCMGLLEGVAFPCTHALLSRWIPVRERGRMTAFVYAGCQVGTIVSLFTSGVMADAWGWEIVFYVQGASTAIWAAAWWLLVFDSPEQHPRLEEEERAMLQREVGGRPRGEGHSAPPLPWRRVLKSSAFWALLVADVGNSWGFFMLLSELPSYLNTVLHRNLQQNALQSALPYLMMWPSSILSGALSDLALRRGFDLTLVRKVGTAVAHLGPAVCLVGVSLAGCWQEGALALLTIAVTLQGAMYSGYMSGHMDMAPDFAATLLGLTNTAASVAALLAPLVVPAIVGDGYSMSKWNIVFYISSGIYVVEFTIYAIWGSSRRQPWAPQDDDDDDQAAVDTSDEKFRSEKEPVPSISASVNPSS